MSDFACSVASLSLFSLHYLPGRTDFRRCYLAGHVLGQGQFVDALDVPDRVKAELPLSTIMRLLKHLGPQIDELCARSEFSLDETAILDFIKNTTMVGLLPVPHAIVIRKYTPNTFTSLWFTAFLWGVIFLQNQVQLWQSRYEEDTTELKQQLTQLLAEVKHAREAASKWQEVASDDVGEDVTDESDVGALQRRVRKLQRLVQLLQQQVRTALTTDPLAYALRALVRSHPALTHSVMLRQRMHCVCILLL